MPIVRLGQGKLLHGSIIKWMSSRKRFSTSTSWTRNPHEDKRLPTAVAVIKSRRLRVGPELSESWQDINGNDGNHDGFKDTKFMPRECGAGYRSKNKEWVKSSYFIEKLGRR